MIIKIENDKSFHPQFIDSVVITSASMRFYWGRKIDSGSPTEQANLQKVLRTINL